MRTVTAWAGFCLTFMLAVSTPASAEWFGDLSVGAAFVTFANESVSVDGSSDSTHVKISGGTGVTGGGRLGYWFHDTPWLGVAMTTSYFGDSGLTVIPVTWLLMARYGFMKSDSYPNGQLQPYLGVGPGLFISSYSVDGQTPSDTAAGVDVRAGVSWLFTEYLGVFGEWRFTKSKPGYGYRDTTLAKDVELTTDLYSNHLLAGLRYSFDL